MPILCVIQSYLSAAHKESAAQSYKGLQYHIVLRIRKNIYLTLDCFINPELCTGSNLPDVTIVFLRPTATATFGVSRCVIRCVHSSYSSYRTALVEISSMYFSGIHDRHPALRKSA